MKKGFTLLELVVVIIIISILATLGLIEYGRVMERGRSAEARSNLGLLRKLQFAYYVENDKYNNKSTFITDNGLPHSYVVYGQCSSHANNPNYYFEYMCVMNGMCYADRCNSGGKSPSYGTIYYITLTIDGVWGGTAGYY